MTRFPSGAIAAALALSALSREAPAVSLSPSFNDSASSVRFESNGNANIAGPPDAAVASRGGMSTRCKELASSIAAATASPERRVEVNVSKLDDQRFVTQSVRDTRGELEAQSMSSGRPKP
ncbi:hypothetical protein QCE63_31830 [Caballeronia sp. LZ065]|uniref:hypothetical protein n=1 Tax=Caballeronia sp. LZ065 TaxID=3038571 RepID=UPI00285DDBCB|nr:hypothetical protein [Caballeronia sp. LZ065]MDR5784011.1 hypothetical protein [Caballeronia sp. LZ065]